MREIRLELAKEAFNTRGFITRKGEFGEKIEVVLYNNGIKIDLAKETPEIILKGLNSKREYAENAVSIENGKAVLTMDQDWNAVSGTFETAYFEVVGQISSVDAQLTTVDVDWYVLPEADISEGQRATYIKKLEEVLKELQDKADIFLEELSEGLFESEKQLNKLQNELERLQADIDSVLEELHAADFYTQEESEQLFLQIENLFDYEAGKDIEVLRFLDPTKNSVSSILPLSTPAMVSWASSEEPDSPFTAGTDLTASELSLLGKADGSTLDKETSVLNERSIFYLKFDVLADLETWLGKGIWQGKTDIADKVTIARKLIQRVGYHAYGKGEMTSPKLSARIWAFNKWNASIQTNLTDEIKDLSAVFSGTTNVNGIVTDEGFVYAVAYSEPSDGSTASRATLDYVALEYKINLNKSLFSYVNVSQDIPSGANLDNYINEGEFSKKTPTVVVGAPEGATGAFRLSVKSMVGSSGLFQVLYDYVTRSIYYRIGNTSLGFNLPWQKVALELSGDIPESKVAFGDGFESYSGQQPIYYKQNGRVYLEGACRPYQVIPKGGGVMFILPSGCRPSTPRSILCQGSNTNVWCLTVETDGQVKVLRYRPTNSTSADTDIPAGAWLPFAMSFKAAD